jgi:hypothetical protein
MNARFLTPLLTVLSATWVGAQATHPGPPGTTAPTTTTTAATATTPTTGTPTTPAPAPTPPYPNATAAAGTPAAPATGTNVRAHICLAPASVQVATGTSVDAMNAVRQVFTSYLTGPTLEVAALTARLPSQARQEAKSDNCPYVLFTTLKQEHSSGGGGSSLLGRMAGGAVQQGAYAASGITSSAGGQVAVNAAGGAAGTAASSYGSTTKPNDQLTLNTHLENGDGKVLVDMTQKKKAESTGEDLLTPLVEQGATAVADAVAKAAPK